LKKGETEARRCFFPTNSSGGKQLLGEFNVATSRARARGGEGGMKRIRARMQTFSRETKTNNAKADILANFGGGDLSPRPETEFL